MVTPPRLLNSCAPSSSSPATRKKSASPYSIPRFSPYKVSKPLLSNNFGHSHPLPAPPVYSLPVTSQSLKTVECKPSLFQATTHVKFEFNLYQDGVQINPTKEQANAILDLFPTATKLSLHNPFIIVTCKQLPPKPWPLTVAGMPLYLTTDANTIPLKLGLGARGPKLKIDYPIKRYEHPTLETFKKVFEALDERGIHLTRLQWVGWRFLGFLSGDSPSDWKSTFPALINGLTMGYLFGEEAIEEKASRIKVPSGRLYDDAVYGDNLRPGVMFAGKEGMLDSELLTTSGVCVKSPSGKKYITCATHGFPGGKGAEIFHPSIHAQRVGTFAKKFWDSDVGLLELNPGLRYDRETFSTTEYLVKPFRKLVNAFSLRIGDTVHFNTPVNGHVEGIFLFFDVLRLPADEPADPTDYITSHCMYFGNGSDTLFDGCCGGPVWTDDFDVVGQFRFMMKDEAVAYCPSFNPLLALNYELSEI